MVQTTAQGQEVNPLAQGAARFLGNALAKATMSVEIDLRPSGSVFFSGNTEMLGLPPDSEGTWDVVSANDDVAHVEFDVDDKTYVAKIVLRDADEFMLKMELPGTPAAQNPATQTPATQPPVEPAAGQVAAVPAAKPAVSDDDKAYEDDDPPAVATPPQARRACFSAGSQAGGGHACAGGAGEEAGRVDPVQTQLGLGKGCEGRG